MTAPWRQGQRRSVIQTASVPSPIGGLNARDSIAAMPDTDALVLRNWFPLPYAVAMRKGWREYVVGMTPGDNATVAVHSPSIGVDKPVVFTGGNVYVITAPGIAPAPLVTGLGSDYWQTTMFSNVGGNYLYSVNGVDNPLIYDGAAFTVVNQNATDPPPGFDIHGVDPKKFIHVAIHQQRLWFVERDSTQGWYLPVNQLGGTAQPFPVGQLWKFGGFLMAIYTWTVDAGQGMDDKLVFISSKGEVAIYAGTNPGDATTWALEGVFRIGSPVGRRCGVSYGGDLLLLTSDGIVPISKALQSTRVNSKENLTNKIQQTISSVVSLYGNLVGWMMLLFQNENQAWLVVPVPEGVQIFVMNTITGSWAQYTNMEIACTCLFGDTPIFITRDGRLCTAWVGYYDNVPWNNTVGERIEMEVLTAYSYFNALGQTKRWTMARPIFQSGTIPESAIDLEVDFTQRTPLILPAPPAARSSDYTWDDPGVPGDPNSGSKWDNARWNIEFQRYRRWQSVQGMGYAAALHMLVGQSVQTIWVATDFVYELGGTI